MFKISGPTRNFGLKVVLERSCCSWQLQGGTAGETGKTRRLLVHDCDISDICDIRSICDICDSRDMCCMSTNSVVQVSSTVAVAVLQRLHPRANPRDCECQTTDAEERYIFPCVWTKNCQLKPSTKNCASQGVLQRLCTLYVVVTSKH